MLSTDTSPKAVLESILSVLVDMPPMFKISGLAVALLFFVTWKMSTNPRVLELLGKSIVDRLQKIHLFRIARIALFLAFIFSVLVVALAFISPILLKLADAHSLDIGAKALQDLRAGNYGLSRRRYRQVLEAAPDETTAEEVRGMITATYYGQGLHQEGLEYICELYKGRAPADTRYVFAVHAHLRALGLKIGKRAAVTLARKMRQRCGRGDFSEFWVHIPFAMMESARTGIPRSRHGYTLDDRDEADLEDQLAGSRTESLTGIVPFEDYARYFLGQFPVLLANFPKSHLRQLALYDAAAFSRDTDRIDFLKRYVSEFPDSRWTPDAYSSLIDELAASGRRAEALRYIAALEESTHEELLNKAFAPSMASIDSLVTAGDFAAAAAAAAAACNQARSLGVDCIDEMRRIRDRAGKLSAMAGRAMRGELDCNSVFFAARAADWLTGGRAFLDRCASSRAETASSTQHGKSLYLLASASRAIGDYARSKEYLLRLVSAHPTHHLADDGLAELGLHALRIEGDWQAARRHLARVVTEFPERNAYDNALWWLAIGSRERGRYLEALEYLSKIVAWKLQDRFASISLSESESIKRLIDMAPFAGSTLANTHGGQYTGLSVTQVDSSSPAARLGLRVGDGLISYCEHKVYDNDDLIRIASPDRRGSDCQVVFRRNQTLLTFSGSGPDPGRWTMKRDIVPEETKD